MSLHFSTVDTPVATLPAPVIAVANRNSLRVLDLLDVRGLGEVDAAAFMSAVEAAQAKIPDADENLPDTTLNELRRLAEYAVKHGLRVSWE